VEIKPWITVVIIDSKSFSRWWKTAEVLVVTGRDQSLKLGEVLQSSFVAPSRRAACKTTAGSRRLKETNSGSAAVMSAMVA
jgi:hypothetical protein